MSRGRPKTENPKSEVLQIRLTAKEKEMLFYTAEQYDFDSVAEMLIEFTKIKYEKLSREADRGEAPILT